MSSGSLKDVVKSLAQTFAEPRVPLPLPDELLQTIEAYLQAHQSIDANDSQKLHDELIKIHGKYVADSSDKHGAFVNVLRHLRPAITGLIHLDEWWKLVIKPTVDAVGHKRETFDDAREFLLSILVFDEDEDSAGNRAALSAYFTTQLLNAYIARTRIPVGEEMVIAPEDDFVAHELESVLVAFGRKRPREFLSAVDRLVLQKSNRPQALGLLSSYVRLQPPHLHLVLQTDLIEHLQQCLLQDTSSTVADLAVTILIMFIPHITSALVSHLPTLLLIYSRLLCWDTQSSSLDSGKAESPNRSSDDDKSTLSMAEGAWDVLNASFDNAESANPRVDYLFTFLYGLFPLNLMSFIRKPRKYLKGVNYPGAEELELKQDMIRSRTEPHRQVHLLHPNFYLTTIEDELNENRWIKAEAADIVTECLNLCTVVSASLRDPGPPPTNALPSIPKSHLRKVPSALDMSRQTVDEDVISPSETASPVSWRNTQSTAVTSQSSHAPTEGYPRATKSRASSVHGAARSSRGNSPSAASRASREAPDSPTIRPQLPIGAGVEVPPLDDQKRLAKSADSAARLKSFTQALSSVQFPVPPSRSPNASNKVASLQRENMLLRNDLNFERYLKQQHLSHIGQLQRKHIREATIEAETQNLFNTNRTLKAKLTKANLQYEQLKKETTTSRSQSKKFEAELTSKVRSYREEERQWQGDEDKLRMECDTLKKDCDNLRRLLVESEQREFNTKNQLQMQTTDLEELALLRAEVEDLQVRLREFEKRELRFEQAEEERQIVQTELDTLKFKMTAWDADREKVRRGLEIKIKDLEAKLEMPRPTSQSTNGGQLPGSVQQMLDSVLATSQSRYNGLKKSYTKLAHKYQDLEMRYADLEANGGIASGPGSPLSFGARSHDFDPPSTSHGLHSTNSMSRRPRGFSETLMAEVDEIMRDDRDTTPFGAPTATATSPPSGSFGSNARDAPARLDSLHHRHAATERARQKESQIHESQEMNPNLSGFLSYNPTRPLANVPTGAKSASSLESRGSDTARPKEKVKVQSEVRVFGRGGAQNIGSKSKGPKSATGDPKPSKNGTKGVRGSIL